MNKSNAKHNLWQTLAGKCHMISLIKTEKLCEGNCRQAKPQLRSMQYETFSRMRKQKGGFHVIRLTNMCFGVALKIASEL